MSEIYKKVENGQKKYFDQLSGELNTQKLVKIHNSCPGSRGWWGVALKLPDKRNLTEDPNTNFSFSRAIAEQSRSCLRSEIMVWVPGSNLAWGRFLFLNKNKKWFFEIWMAN